jgi:hypothetical protein
MTLGAWVKSSVAAKGALTVYDNLGSSTATTTGTGWEWLETTHTISSGATTALFWIKSDTATTFVSQPMLVFGSAIGAGNYSRPMGEIVNLDAAVRVVNGTSPVAADDEILNLEALSSGKIPKGAKAVFLRTLLSNSSITSAQGVKITSTSVATPQLDNYPMVDNVRSSVIGRVGCDSNGDVYQEITEADATLSGYYVDATAVELR